LTPEDADQLYVQLRRMSLRQLFALWRLVYTIISYRAGAAALPDMDATYEDLEL
jgi:hypothetical protein